MLEPNFEPKGPSPIENIGSVAYLKRPDTWFHPGVCPVKHKNKLDPNSDKTLGVVFPGRPVVYAVNLYQLPTMTETEIASSKQFEYADFEALVADGWIVD